MPNILEPNEALPTEQLLKVLERQRQILNELARLCCQIEEKLTGKLAEREKAQKETCHELV